MTSEIRVNKLQNRVGLGTIEYSNTGPVISGVTTSNNFKTGTTNVHNVGIEAAGINVLGADTPIGTGSTIYNSGAAVFTGIITASKATIGSELKVSNLTSGRVVFTTTGGQLEASGNLTYNGTTLASGSPLDINSDLDVDGHTNLDNVSVAGVSTFSGNVHLLDNVELNLGTNNDLEIFHNDDDAYIRNNKGALILRNNGQSGDADASQIYIQATPAENSISCAPNGAVTLYNDNDPKLSTNAAGVLLYKDLDVDGHTNLDNVSIAGITTVTNTLPEIRLKCSDANLDQSDVIGKLTFQTSDPTTPSGAGNVSHIEVFSANGNGADYTTSIFNRSGSGGGETMIRLGNALGQIRMYTSAAGASANEKLRIESTGRIVFGPTNTQLNGSSPFEIRQDSSSMWNDYPEHVTLVDQKAYNSADNGSGITFGGKYNNSGNVTTFGSIHARKQTTGDGNYGGFLTFHTREHGNSNFERMRIDSTGRVFINSVGPTTPTADYRSLNLVAHAHSEAGLSFSRSHTVMGSGVSAGKSIILHSTGYLYVSTHNVGEDVRITNQGRVGINYAGTPPEETVMIRPARDGTVSRVTLSHISSGNSYGARISTIGGASKGFDLATVFNSSYITRARMTDRGLIQLSPSNSIASAPNSFVLNIATSYSATYPVYSGIALKNLETGGGNGMCVHTTSAQWDLYTRAGNQSGLNIGHSNSASSSNSRMYITEAGHFAAGTDVYARLSTSRKAHTVFHVTGGGLSIGPYGDTSSTKEGGRYVLGWYMKTHTTSHSYVHLELQLWGGAAPTGNTEYIMGGFHIHGHQYSGSGVSEERIYFHNWGGTLHGHSRHHTGTWDPGNNVYINSAGWVTLRLLAGSYRGYVIDLVQHAWYNVRDITIRSYQTSNSSTI